MNIMGILGISLIIVILIAVILGFLVSRYRRRLKKTEATVGNLRHSVSLLGTHIKKQEELHHEEGTFEKMVMESRTDEDYFDIVGAVVLRNNDRVLHTTGDPILSAG